MSFESEREHLLAPHSIASFPRASSLASLHTSIAEVLEASSSPRPSSTLVRNTESAKLSSPSTSPAFSRYGFKSEEVYLAALRAWIEDKEYVQLDGTSHLIGFYGKTTAEMYKQRPGLRSHKQKKSAQTQTLDKERDQTSFPAIATRPCGQVEEDDIEAVKKGRSRKGTVMRWLSRSQSSNQALSPL